MNLVRGSGWQDWCDSLVVVIEVLIVRGEQLGTAGRSQEPDLIGVSILRGRKFDPQVGFDPKA